MPYAQSFIVIGAQESGKTYFVIKEFVAKTKRPVLAILAHDLEPKWKSFRLIEVHQINNLKPGGKYRLVWDRMDKRFWYKVWKYTRNYMIIFDDAGLFLNDSQAKWMQDLFCINRQTNNHVFWLAHSFGRPVPAPIWDYASYAVIFRTTGKPERVDYKLPEWVVPIAEKVNEMAKKNQYAKIIYKMR